MNVSTHQTKERQCCTQVHDSWHDTKLSSLKDKESAHKVLSILRKQTHVNQDVATPVIFSPHCSKHDDVKPDPIRFDQGPGLLSIWGFVIFGESERIVHSQFFSLDDSNHILMLL